MSVNSHRNPMTRDAKEPRRLKQCRTMIEEPKRATRACDQCRRLKEKCEGGVPCRRCTHSRRTCEFKSIPTQAYHTRLNPTSSGAAISNSRELLERSMYMERILKHNFEGISLDTNNLSRMAESLTRDRPGLHRLTDLHEQEADDLAIEEEVCTIVPVEDTTTHYSGEFSYWNFSMRIKRHIDDRMTSSNSPSAPDFDQVPVYWRARQLNSGSNDPIAAISCFPPRPIAVFLVNIFFKYAESHYFYVDEGWVRDRLDMLYNDPSSFSIKGPGTIGIILTVLAIGTQYAYLDSSNPNSTTKATPVFSEDEVGTMFYQQAIKLLPEIIELSSLESVQSCLLFGVYALTIDASGLGYIYINLATRLAMQNGMHRNYSGEAFNPAMIETRNRIWWTAYTLERKICIFHGRPLSTLRSDVEAELPKARGDLLSDSINSNIPYMIASIHLTQRLEDCYHSVSLLRNCQKQELPNVLSDLLGMKRTLEEWWETLLDELRNDQATSKTQFRAEKHLRLEYCLVCMFVGRPFLFNRAFPSPHCSPHESRENKTPDSTSLGYIAVKSPKPRSCRTELVDYCIQAAKEALGICRSLRDSGSGLARASYLEYSACRASLLVLIAYSIQNQSDQFSKLLGDGLDMIRDMAAAGDSARSEILLIEALERALTRLRSFGATFAGGEDVSAAGSLSSGYDRFKHWESMWKSGAAANATLNKSIGSQHVMPASFSPSPRASDQSSHGWSMDGLGQIGEASFSYSNPNTIRTFHSNGERTILGGENIAASSGWPDLSERQVLEEFLAGSQPTFDFGTRFENMYEPQGSEPL